MFTLIFFSAAGYGIYRLAQFAKENPARSIEAARWVKRLLSK
jgi:hypothetical protein